MVSIKKQDKKHGAESMRPISGPLSRGISISRALTVFLVAGLAVLGLSVCLVVAFGAYQELQHVQESNRYKQTVSRANAIWNYVENRIIILEDLSKLPILTQSVMQPEFNQARSADLMPTLSVLGEHPQMMLLDFQGKVIHATRPEPRFEFHNDKGVSEVLSGARPFHIRIDYHDDASFWSIVVPIEYNEYPEGALAVVTPLSAMGNFLGFSDSLRDEEISVIDGERTACTYGVLPSIHDERRVPIPHLNLELIQRADTSMIRQSRNMLLLKLIVIFLLTAIPIGAIEVYLGRKAFARPLERLRSLANGIVSGDDSVPWDFSGEHLREVRLLAKDFDTMLKRLKRRETSLTLKTRDLFDLNDALTKEIAEKKQVELALQEQLSFLQRLIDTIPNPIFYKDAGGIYIGCNHAFELYLDLPRKQIIGQSSSDLRMHEPVVVYRESDGLASPFSDADHYEARIQCSDGRMRNVIVNKAPFTDSEGQTMGHVYVIMDVTERKRLESKLLQAQKLESIGSLAAGIAHEINTPIQFIGDNTHFLFDGFKDLMAFLRVHRDLVQHETIKHDYPSMVRAVHEKQENLDIDYLLEEIPRAIEQTLSGVEHVTKIIRSMKEFSHPGQEQKEDTDMNRAIENTITVTRNEWKYAAEVITDFDSNLPPVPCRQGEFTQVIMNLIINAAHAITEKNDDAMDRKGTITISTKLEDNRVEIRVTDDGTGIPEAIRDRIFDPFFTTKEVGRGTGQGLPVSRSIIEEKHGGSLSFESEIGHGTTFIITLPIFNTDEARSNFSSW
jgi:PAS domain S-box-containing protein